MTQLERLRNLVYPKRKDAVSISVSVRVDMDAIQHMTAPQITALMQGMARCLTATEDLKRKTRELGLLPPPEARP